MKNELMYSKMENDIIDYLIKYYLHLWSPEFVSKLKYLYLQEEEKENDIKLLKY